MEGKEEIMMEVDRMKEEKKSTIRKGIVIFVAVLIVTAVILFRAKFSDTGYQVVVQSEYETVSGGSTGTGLSFEMIPNIKAEVGEKVRMKINANQADVAFSDNTQLFDIEKDGTIEFKPESPGYHRVFVIVTNNAGEFYYQDFRITIDE